MSPRAWLAAFFGAVLATLVVGVAALLVATPLLQPTRPTLAPDSRPLPAVAEVPRVCAGVGAGTVLLAGDAADPRLAWETALDGTGRQDVIWPPGYRARFTPRLEVIAADGRVVARAGDTIPAGGCVAGPPDNPRLVIFVDPGGWTD
jgi:hypothetical protein